MESMYGDPGLWRTWHVLVSPVRDAWAVLSVLIGPLGSKSTPPGSSVVTTLAGPLRLNDAQPCTLYRGGLLELGVKG